MTDGNLKYKLLELVRKAGICRDGYARMWGMSVNDIVEYYLENPDWCLEHGIPGLDILRRNFADRTHQGIFIDRTFEGELLNDNPVYILHNCKGVIRTGLNFNKKIIPMFYLADDCDLVFEGEPVPGQTLPWKVPVYTFGLNDVVSRDGSVVALKVYTASVLNPLTDNYASIIP